MAAGAQTRSSRQASPWGSRAPQARLKLASQYDTRVHSGHRASHRLICDTGAHVLRSAVSGDLGSQGRQDRQGRSALPASRRCRSAAAFELNATFTLAELLRNGDDICRVRPQLNVQDALHGEVTRLGVRAYATTAEVG